MTITLLVLCMTQPTKKMPGPIVIPERNKSYTHTIIPCRQFGTPPIKITSEEEQGKDQKEKNDGGDTREEEDRREDKTQADDCGQEADEDDFLDYSDSDFI